MTVEDMISILRSKLDYASSTQFRWDPNEYFWIIGVDVYRKLEESLRPEIYIRNISEDVNKCIMGIRIEKIDTVYRERIALCKEV